MRESRTSGSVRGASGDWRFYSTSLRRVVFIGDGKGEKGLKPFWEALGPRGRRRIRGTTSDLGYLLHLQLAYLYRGVPAGGAPGMPARIAGFRANGRGGGIQRGPER